MTLAAVGTVAACLAALAGTLLTLMNLRAWANEAVSQVELSAFLDRSLDQKDMERVVEQVRTLPNVKTVRFVSREEALRRLQQRFRGRLDLSDLEADNPLEDSLEVATRSQDQLDATAGAIRAIPGVHEVLYGREVAERLLHLRRVVRMFGIGVALLTALLALFIIHNTIRLTVLARQREIRIMQLVGATDGFIRAPFLLEGMLYGLAGGILAAAAVLALYSYLLKLAALWLPFVTLVSDASLLTFFGCGLVGAGALFGWTGSLFSIRKCLNGT